jgi:hypothetical protein
VQRTVEVAAEVTDQVVEKIVLTKQFAVQFVTDHMVSQIRDIVK